MSFDKVDELLEMSECSARESLLEFVKKKLWLCLQTSIFVSLLKQICNVFFVSIKREDFQDLLAVGTANTETEKTAQLRALASSREKKPTQVLEAIAVGGLWIWVRHFEIPGSLNDVNVLDSCPLVRLKMKEKLLPLFEYERNGHKYNGLYFPVNGIQLHGAVFVSTISELGTIKERLFASAQEAIWKNDERAFGVLLSRWALLIKSFMFYDRDVISMTVRAAVFLCNIVVESRRNEYESNLWRFAEEATKKGNLIDSDSLKKPFTWIISKCLIVEQSLDFTNAY